jgi:uncharacterized protein (DUF1501 family)
MTMNPFGRRHFLQGSAVLLASFGVSADPGARKRKLVFLFLTGGLDGLSVLSPTAEAGLRELRPGLLDEKAIPLESGLALHPALAPLLPLYRDNVLAFAHAVGQPDPTRSHFDAQDYLELGTPGVKSTRDGWLSRALQLSSAGGPRTPLDAVAISQHLPRSLQGGAKAFAFGSLGAVRLRPLAGGPGGARGRSLARDTFEALYAGARDPNMAAAGKETFEALALLEERLGLDGRGRDESTEYPRTAAGNSLRQLAALIKADLGLRVGCASIGGWDTHANQPGELSRRLGDLGRALAAFWSDLGDARDDTLLVAVTEFGRTVRQNGALGTDHGHGSIALMLGGRVDGGKVYGRWPGASPAALHDGRDLAVTTDVRAVLATAAEAQLGVSDLGALFPGYRGSKLGYLRAPGLSLR